MITKIQLSHFRNFRKKLISFSPKTNVIVGPNASGKTNILESVYLLSTGKSFRARVEEEMVNYRKEIARVDGVFEDKLKLSVVLTRGEITVGVDPKKSEKVARKRLLVNGDGKRLLDFAGRFRVVLFAPDDLDLVTESPSRRRGFLDMVLSQVDREYRRAQLSYEKGLRQRNKLLLRIREDLPAGRQEVASRGQLLFWNRLLVKNGDYISEKRREFIDFVNGRPDFDGSDFSLEYDRSTISEARLEQYAKEEVYAATTLVGPHRDDFCFRLRKPIRQAQGGHARDLAKYGSRGEQRMGTLWLKLAELSYIEEKIGDKATLLLDDIFSELDHEHRDIVMGVTKGHQTIITTADPHFVEEFKKVEKIQLK